jgi:hypothetical protein
MANFFSARSRLRYVVPSLTSTSGADLHFLETNESHAARQRCLLPLNSAIALSPPHNFGAFMRRTTPAMAVACPCPSECSDLSHLTISPCLARPWRVANFAKSSGVCRSSL